MARRARMLSLLCLVCMFLLFRASESSASGAARRTVRERGVKDSLRAPDQRASAAAAAGVHQPSIIGADGEEFTQVERAQQELQLDGTGVRVGVVDTGVDYLNTDTFGVCTAIAQPADTCRVVAGLNAANPSRPPIPRDLYSNGYSHGTHVAGIIAGAYPHKLRDEGGFELQYQRGVAFNASIGAYVDDDNTTAFKTAASRDSMHVINYSSGWQLPGLSTASDFVGDSGQGVVLVAAAGNEGDSGLHSLCYPSADADKISAANIRNTAVPGAALTLSVPIGAERPTSVLRAWMRADTPSSLEGETFGGELPAQLVLVRCALAGNKTHLAGIADQMRAAKSVAVLDCFPSSGDIVRVALMAKAILLAYNKTQKYASSPRVPGVPTFLLDAGDAKTLLQALSSVQQPPLQLTRVSALLVPLAGSMQPDWTTSWGPSAELAIKPDLAAAGSLYSAVSLGGNSVMFGTSMATPYIAGAVALWRQHRARVWGSMPPGGWTAAALRDFKVTAKAVELQAGLMWPAARVGAGIIQVYNAITNPIAVEPYELKLPSAQAVHVVNLTLTNALPHDISFTLRHARAASISLAGAWGSYGSSSHFLDASAPTAAVTFEPAAVVTVPGLGSAQVTVRLEMAGSLATSPYLVSGYIQLQPLPSSPGGVPLSVVYQGSTLEYSDAHAVPVLAEESSMAATGMAVQDKRMCVLGDAYLDAYYSTSSNVLWEPTCPPADDGSSYPAVVVVTPDELAAGLFCIAVANVRPMAARALLIERQQPDGSFEAVGEEQLGPAFAINAGPAIPCHVWDGTVTTPDGARKIVAAGDALYRVTLSLTPPIPIADAGRVTAARHVSVELPQLVQVVES